MLSEEKISDHSTIVIDLTGKRQVINKKETVEKLVKYSKEGFLNDLLRVKWDVSEPFDLNQEMVYCCTTGVKKQQGYSI